MSRRNAAVAGFVAWLVALLWAPEKTVSGLAIWGLIAAVGVTLSVVAGRSLSRALKRAVLKDEQ